MRLSHLLVGLAALVTGILAWSQDDYEIFDLVSALEASEGRGIDFYTHLGVEPSASANDINKAYRKKSLELHPDKNPGVKNVQERFARLGVISQILRSGEKRERYNFFYKNGVPKWRGTGYYYSRYRPTLAHTLIFLTFLTSLLHLLVMQLNYNRDLRRVNYFTHAAMNATGKRKEGDSGTGEKRRKVKVPMVEGNEMGGMLELVVQGDEVYIPHEDGSSEPLTSLVHPPSIFRTWPVVLTRSIVRRIILALPVHLQQSLPAPLRPHPQISDSSDLLHQEPPTPLRRKDLRNGRRSKTNTPKDSPATTEVESDDEVDGDGTEDAGGDGKKKRGPGKAGGMRKRKMGLKK